MTTRTNKQFREEMMRGFHTSLACKLPLFSSGTREHRTGGTCKRGEGDGEEGKGTGGQGRGKTCKRGKGDEELREGRARAGVAMVGNE